MPNRSRLFASGLLCWLSFLAPGESSAAWRNLDFGMPGLNQVIRLDSATLAANYGTAWIRIDNHDNWSKIPIIPNAAIRSGSRIVVVGNSGENGYGGVISTADGGGTWQSLIRGADPSDSLNLLQSSCILRKGRYWLVGTLKGIYRSGDEGLSWSKVDTSIEELWRPQRVDGIFDLGRSIVAVGVDGFYRSKDSGSAGSWTRIAPTQYDIADGTYAALGGILFGVSSTGILYRSPDGGIHWSAIPNLYFKTLAPMGKVLWAADLGGMLMRSDDSGVTWTGQDRWLEFMQMSAQGSVIYGVHRDGRLFRSGNGGMDFESVAGPPSGAVTAMAADSAHILSGFQGGRLFVADEPAQGATRVVDSTDTVSFPGAWVHRYSTVTETKSYRSVAADGERLAISEGQGVWVSSDGGKNWRFILDASLKPSIVSVSSVHLAGQAILVAGASCLFRSEDDGKTWNCVHDGPGYKIGYGNRPVSVRRGNDFFLGDSGGVFHSSDAGSHWEATGLKGPIIALAAAGGELFAAGPKGLYRSSSGGGDWSRMDSTRTKIRAMAAVGPMLYIADPKGIAASPDGGTTWRAANEGLLDTADVLFLAAFGPNLFAGTARAGMGWRPLGEMASDVSIRGAKGLAPMALRAYKIGEGLRVSFSLAYASEVSLELLDLSGRKTAGLEAGALAAGAHAMTLKVAPRPGVYFLRLRAGGRSFAQQVAWTE